MNEHKLWMDCCAKDLKTQKVMNEQCGGVDYIGQMFMAGVIERGGGHFAYRV